MGKRKSARRPEAPYKPQKPSAAEIYAQEARQLFREGKPERAIPILRQAVDLAPKNAKLHYELGKWLIRQKHRSEGTSYLEKSLEADPDHVPALIELAQEYSKKNLFDKARPLIEKALELSPETPPAHTVYGTLLQKQGKLPQAVEQFRTALKLRLDHPLPFARPEPRKEDFDKPETEALMWETLSLLAKAGVHAFPVGGTLLGLVREGGLLPFDKDMDFGLPYYEMERASRCLEGNGWICKPSPHIINPLPFVHPVKKVTLDLGGFVVDKASGDTYHGFWLDNVPWEWSRTTRWPSIKLKKDTTPDGKPIWALQDPASMLEAGYGDWRTPDPDFDSVIAEKNLCGFSLLTQCYAFARIYDKWEKRQLAKALALVGHTRRHLPDDTLMQELESHLEAILPKDQASTDETPSSARSRSTGDALEGPDDSFGADFDVNHEKLTFDS